MKCVQFGKVKKGFAVLVLKLMVNAHMQIQIGPASEGVKTETDRQISLEL